MERATKKGLKFLPQHTPPVVKYYSYKYFSAVEGDGTFQIWIFLFEFSKQVS